jgi:hypothetical protein
LRFSRRDGGSVRVGASIFRRVLVVRACLRMTPVLISVTVQTKVMCDAVTPRDASWNLRSLEWRFLIRVPEGARI